MSKIAPLTRSPENNMARLARARELISF